MRRWSGSSASGCATRWRASPPKAHFLRVFRRLQIVVSRDRLAQNQASLRSLRDRRRGRAHRRSRWTGGTRWIGGVSRRIGCLHSSRSSRSSSWRRPRDRVLQDACRCIGGPRLHRRSIRSISIRHTWANRRGRTVLAITLPSIRAARRGASGTLATLGPHPERRFDGFNPSHGRAQAIARARPARVSTDRRRRPRRRCVMPE
jgi:hypothetical protein